MRRDDLTAKDKELAALRSEVDVLRTALEDAQTTMAAMRNELARLRAPKRKPRRQDPDVAAALILIQKYRRGEDRGELYNWVRADGLEPHPTRQAAYSRACALLGVEE